MALFCHHLGGTLSGVHNFVKVTRIKVLWGKAGAEVKSSLWRIVKLLENKGSAHSAYLRILQHFNLSMKTIEKDEQDPKRKYLNSSEA